MTIKPTIFLGCALLALSLQSQAQAPFMVDYATVDIMNNGSVSQTLDTIDVFYSNGRAGVATPPDINYSNTLSTQTFLYDSTKSKTGASNWYVFYTEFHRSYDNNNNIVMQQNGGLNDYPNRQLLSYDANNKLIERVTQEYGSHTNYTWRNRYRDSMSYNTSGQLLARYQFTWDQSTNTWLKAGPSHVYTYANNLIDKVEYYTWNISTQTSVLLKSEQYYYTVGVLDSIELYLPSTTPPNSLAGVTRYIYSGNDITEELFQYTNATYKKTRKTISKYNTSGQLTETEAINANQQSNVWLNGGYKTTYTYNSVSGTKEMTHIQSYNNTNNAYTNYSKTLYVHNSNSLFSYINHQYWDANNNSWKYRQDDTTLTYHYKMNTSSVHNTVNDNATISLYPIPASGFITLDVIWQKEQDFVIAIYNMQGQLVRQTTAEATLHYNQQIPVADLPSGNYILEVRNQEGSTTKQFMKK